MGAITKSWTDEANIYQTDGYTGSDADIDGTERFTSDIDLETSGYEGVQVHIKYDASGTTDNLVCAVYGSLDGTNYSDFPIKSIVFDNNAGVETEVSFILKDYQHFRIGFVRSGSTDTFELDCDVTYWKWNAA